MSAIADARAFLQGDSSKNPQIIVADLLAHIDACALMAPGSEERAIADRLAGEFAEAVIERNCKCVMDDYYDLTTAVGDAVVDDAVRLLSLRGAIVRHATFQYLVKVVWP